MLLPAPHRDQNEKRNERWLTRQANAPEVRDILNVSLQTALERGEDIYLQLRGSAAVLIFEGVESREERIAHRHVAPLNARLKCMAGLDPANTHEAQVGKFTLNLDVGPIEVNVVNEPMLLGEEFRVQLIKIPQSEIDGF